MSQQFVVLDANTLSVIDWYCSDFTYIAPTPGIRLKVPEGLTWDIVKGVQEDGEVTLQTDPAKLAQKTADQWTQVRSQQRQKLYESDWTCSVTDYEVPNKSEWVQYRADLRNVTLQSDPFNIQWPVAPV